MARCAGGSTNYGAWPNPMATTGGGSLKYCIFARGGPAAHSYLRCGDSGEWRPLAWRYAAVYGDRNLFGWRVPKTSPVKPRGLTGIRFYKASANLGTHVGTLWTSAGARLATATFTGETAAGWQQVNFVKPVSISSNRVYVVSYHVNSGHYSADDSFFRLPGWINRRCTLCRRAWRAEMASIATQPAVHSQP